MSGLPITWTSAVWRVFRSSLAWHFEDGWQCTNEFSEHICSGNASLTEPKALATVSPAASQGSVEGDHQKAFPVSQAYSWQTSYQRQDNPLLRPRIEQLSHVSLETLSTGGLGRREVRFTLLSITTPTNGRPPSSDNTLKALFTVSHAPSTSQRVIERSRQSCCPSPHRSMIHHHPSSNALEGSIKCQPCTPRFLRVIEKSSSPIFHRLRFHRVVDKLRGLQGFQRKGEERHRG